MFMCSFQCFVAPKAGHLPFYSFYMAVLQEFLHQDFIIIDVLVEKEIPLAFKKSDR